MPLVFLVVRLVLLRHGRTAIVCTQLLTSSMSGIWRNVSIKAGSHDQPLDLFIC